MTEAADVMRHQDWRPPLPTVAEFGRWVRLVMSRLAPGDSLESTMACSMLVVSYARALARASGRDEQALLLEAAEVFRSHLGTCEAAEQALGLVGVDVAEVAQSFAEEQREAEEDAREVGPW